MPKLIQMKDKDGKIFPKTFLTGCQCYVTTRYNQSVPTAWTTHKIPLNGYMYKDNQFSISDGGIKIGKNVNKVLVMANICHFASSGGQFDIQIAKNGGTVLSLYGYIDTAGINNKSAQRVIDVNEGDIIYLHFHTGTTGSHTIFESTNLTIVTLA